MKRFFKKITFLLVFIMIANSIQPGNAYAAPKNKKYVKSLTLAKKTLQISLGGSKSLSYRVKTKGKASKKITAKASNAKVKVSVKNGKITIRGKQAGYSKITVSTKGKNRNGKKLKKNIRIKIVKKKTPAKKQVTPKPTKGGNTNTPKKVAVTRKEWLSAVMKATNYTEQKELFDCDKNGTPIYSFTDITGLAECGIIETAAKYQIIPETGGNFKPNAAADREFLAVTSVRAIGLAANSQDADCQDKANLKYETEDAIAINLKLLTLAGNKFLPARSITVKEKDNAIKILTGIVNARKVDENHADVIQYSEDVAQKNDVTDYTVTNNNGIYTAKTAKGTSLDNISKGDKFILPATDKYPEGIALIASSNARSLGASTVITGTAPQEITEFLDTVDIEGTAEADAEHATAVAGVSTLKVIPGEKQATRENPNRKKAKADDSIDISKYSIYQFNIKEINTTISFSLSKLTYKVDFDKKRVKELYIGLPTVFSLDTNFERSKKFSKKIGDIPVELPAGLSVNLQVYAEASIDGSITIDFDLVNEIGIQYLNGQFYLKRNTSPYLDIIAKADAEAGIKAQLGLYWMKKVKELFGEEDPRPIYNVYTRWGLHGNAKLQIRNDQYTSFKDLTCIDLGYYLYGTVDIGDGSFLGDTFNLKKEWKIFDEANSPLKGTWHIENGRKVDACTYKSGAILDALKEYAEKYSYLCVDSVTYDAYVSYEGKDNDGFDIIKQSENIPNHPFAYDIDDYDADGTVELLMIKVLTEEPDEHFSGGKMLYLEMYEYEDGSVIKKATKGDGISDTDYSVAIAPYNTTNDNSTTVFKCNKNNIPLITFNQSWPTDTVGITGNFWQLKYNGESFENVGHIWYGGIQDDYYLKEQTAEFAAMGIIVDMKQVFNGQKNIVEFIPNASIIGNSATKVITNWFELDEFYNKPSQKFKISETTFSKNISTRPSNPSSSDKMVEASGINLDKTSETLESGQSLSLTATISPSNATDKTIIWRSSNPTVAAVSNGIVTGLSAGTSTITAETHNGKSATCLITVTDNGAITKIRNATQLIAIADKLDGGYALASDIDLSGYEWKPIGTKSKPFQGTFDGAGYRITGLNITEIGDGFRGLFGYSKGTLKNVNVSGSIQITGSIQTAYIGGICGYSEEGGILSSESHVSIRADINTTTSGAVLYAGGVTGLAELRSTVSNCMNVANVVANATGNGRVSTYAGGISGITCNGATVEKCTNQGGVHAYAQMKSTKYFLTSYAGGITGDNSIGTVKDCVNSGNVKAEGVPIGKSNYGCAVAAGGIIGHLGSESQSGNANHSASIQAVGNEYVDTVKKGDIYGY